MKIDISHLEIGKEYLFKVIYQDAVTKEPTESEWIRITLNEAWTSSFSDTYYPIAYKEINQQ